LLIAVVLLAAAFRFARLYWGLDGGRWFVDEKSWAVRIAFFNPVSWASLQAGGLLYPPLYAAGGAGSAADPRIHPERGHESGVAPDGLGGNGGCTR
jgi:hypothetical protein